MKDARTLADDIVAMSQEEFSAAFRKSPMKRAKLAGLQRNAKAVLDSVPTPSEDQKCRTLPGPLNAFTVLGTSSTGNVRIQWGGLSRRLIERTQG